MRAWFAVAALLVSAYALAGEKQVFLDSPGVLEALDAREITAPFLMRTSYPAQADLSFVLDDIRYHARIRLDAPAKPTPAKPKPVTPK